MTEKILIILDLDETLLFATQNELDYPPHHVIWPYHVYLRPFFHSFLGKIQPHFELALWSSASDEYVEAMVKTVFPKDFEFHFFWGRSRCTPLLHAGHEGHYRPDEVLGHQLFVKKLKKVKRIFKWPMERILIVDDTPEKCLDNYGNAIYINEFNGERDDVELLKLTDYLISLKDVPNVRAIEKRGWAYAPVIF